LKNLLDVAKLPSQAGFFELNLLVSLSWNRTCVE